MEIKKIQFADKISNTGSGSMVVRLKEHGSGRDKINNEELQQIRPAKQQSLGGSERLKDSVSFTGNPRLIQNIATNVLNSSADNIPKWADKLGNAKWFSNVLRSVDKNEAFYEAAVALVVAGVLKPICVLSMPGAEKEDKQMAATKNAVSAFIGFGLSNLLLSPCSEAVNKITKSFDSVNPTKYIKDTRYIEALKNDNLVGTAKSTLGEAYKSAYKKFPDLGVAPLKAGITIALTPIVLKWLFGDTKKKKDKNKEQVANPIETMTVMNSIRMDANNNKTESSNPSFKGGIKTDNVSFKGGGVDEFIDISKDVVTKNKHFLGKLKDKYTNALGEPLAKLFGKISSTRVAQKIVEGTSHFEKPSPRWSDLASIAITFFYINNTRKSEKIEPERKLPLMINNGMVTVASSLAALGIDKLTDKPMEYLLEGYVKNHEADILNKSCRNIKRTLSNIKDFANPSDVDLNNIKNLNKHGKEMIAGGIEGMSKHFQDAVRVLKSDDVVKRAVDAGLIKAEEIAEIAACGFTQESKKIFSNMSKTKSLTIFTITVRFLVTVLMTPIIGKVVALVNKKLGKDEGSKEKTAKPNPNVPPAGSETIGMKDYLNSLNK